MKKPTSCNAFDEPIDFVVLWVDGSDPVWRAEKARVTGAADVYGNQEERFRDWGLLRYWFRGVEKFAPWVRTVHFVTWGHVPEWLDVSHPKLSIVNHRDFIPEEYLPTFNCNPIELNLHRIEGLSERFVYFNDDMFVVSPVEATDFFKRGMPCCSAILTPLNFAADEEFLIPLSDARALNRHFRLSRCIRGNIGGWVNPARYGKDGLRSAVFFPIADKCGILEDHLPTSLLKGTYDKVWEAEYETLHTTCSHRLRGSWDVNQWLLRSWQICEGNFAPRSTKFGKKIQLFRGSDAELCAIKDALGSGNAKVLCVNDSGSIRNFERCAQEVRRCFEEILPEKSRFES